eukprot:SAG22_NODE_2086_length_3031_cov_4.223056_5_plen_161_part_00
MGTQDTCCCLTGVVRQVERGEEVPVVDRPVADADVGHGSARHRQGFGPVGSRFGVQAEQPGELLRRFRTQDMAMGLVSDAECRARGNKMATELEESPREAGVAVRTRPRARPTAGGACEASVEVTKKSAGPPPSEQWCPDVNSGAERGTATNNPWTDQDR